MSRTTFQRLSTYTAAATFLSVFAPASVAAAVVAVLALATAWSGWRARLTGTVQMFLVVLLVANALAILVLGVVGPDLLPQVLPVAYLGVAMLVFAAALALAVTGTEVGHRMRGPVTGTAQWLLPLGAATAVYLTMLTGGYAKALGLACTSWPLCDGRWLPALAGADGAHFVHRLAALVAGVLVTATAVATWRSYRHRPWLQGLALAAVALFLVATSVGAIMAVSYLPAAASANLAVAVGLFATLLALAVSMPRVAPLPRISGGETATATVTVADARLFPLRDVVPVVIAYIMLMKPRIILLLLITTYAAMWVAAGGPPPLGLTLATLVGGTLSSGAANALNMYLDRDIDAVMHRTRKRPVPSGRLGPEQALQFGIITGVVSFVLLAVAVNLLAAVLATCGLLFYVFVYTKWLKRITDQNIVIGGAAGAVPPLVGWAAITGTVGWAAIFMFLIVFLWTPPHFWALALFRKEDYARAGVPMLPVVRGEAYTKWQILLYSVLTLAATLALYPLQVVGPWYLAVAAASGAYLMWAAVAVLRDRSGSMRSAHVLFGYSILYLGIIFGAMVVDARGIVS